MKGALRRLAAEVYRERKVDPAAERAPRALVGKNPKEPGLAASLVRVVSVQAVRAGESNDRERERSLNVTAGARNVSTVPTQALTLLNNPFVLAQAQRLADRVSQQARDPYSQVNLAYGIALARPATEAEIAVGLDLIKRYSLVDLTHVIVNLNEFLYMR